MVRLTQCYHITRGIFYKTLFSPVKGNRFFPE